MAAYSWHSLTSPAPLSTSPCEALAVNLRQPLRRDNIRLPLNFRSPSIPPIPTPTSAYSDTRMVENLHLRSGFPLITELTRPRGHSRRNVREIPRTFFFFFLYLCSISLINNETAKRIDDDLRENTAISLRTYFREVEEIYSAGFDNLHRGI